MPQVARKGDICSGHGWFPPRKSASGSDTVYVNKISVHRKDDAWDAHSCKGSVHDSQLENGWKSVFVEGREIGYVGAKVKCGSEVKSGSENVFVGEMGI